jgi:hypothetical protein
MSEDLDMIEFIEKLGKKDPRLSVRFNPSPTAIYTDGEY